MAVLGSTIVSFFSMLIGVAFFIVLERKVLGMVQLRMGPNKVSMKGVFQFLADGVKMVSKGLVVPSNANSGLFIFAPVMMFVLSYCIWVIFPSELPISYFKYSVLFFLAVSAANVFGLIICGWSSNSSYALLGSMRAVAQTISYEVSMSILLFCPFIFNPSFEFHAMSKSGFSMVGLCMEVVILWGISIIAETNRAPFDFVEGESELVAGYHVEMGGFMFALIALAEYGAMVVVAVFSTAVFFGGFNSVLKTITAVVICLFFILVRGSLPRYRYDKLMDFCWKTVLPLSLALFMLHLSI